MIFTTSQFPHTNTSWRSTQTGREKKSNSSSQILWDYRQPEPQPSVSLVKLTDFDPPVCGWLELLLGSWLVISSKNYILPAPGSNARGKC